MTANLVPHGCRDHNLGEHFRATYALEQSQTLPFTSLDAVGIDRLQENETGELHMLEVIRLQPIC